MARDGAWPLRCLRNPEIAAGRANQSLVALRAEWPSIRINRSVANNRLNRADRDRHCLL
jgi:hypothetical protein